MDVETVLSELEKLGPENDSQAERKDQKYLNITRDTGEFLALLIKVGAVRKVLEVGTSNGYSTLWLASALPEDGLVTTLEILPHKIKQAGTNFRRAKLDHKIKIIQSDVGSYLRECNEVFDLVFLDADRKQYMDVVTDVLASLRPGGVLICDNAISHRSEMQEFMDFVSGTGGFTTALVSVGKGEFVACKSA